MNFIEKEGRNISQATNKALLELEITEDEAYVKVIDEGKPGIFGIGGRPAKVQVTQKFSTEKYVEPFLKELFNLMQLNVEYYASMEDSNRLNLHLIGTDVKYLIGKRGLTLNALQDYFNLAFNRLSSYKIYVQLDIADYRDKRKETLEKLAESVSQKVLKSKRPMTLNPMNSFERKVIHTVLQDVKNIKTSSTGIEPNRKVVVSYVQD